jgi:diguanylate cyclase (GGDEF)-like protein
MKDEVEAKTGPRERLTIGLIVENSAHENENRMRAGIMEAAERFDVHLICFTHLEAAVKNISYGVDDQYRRSHDFLLQLVEQFELDGLIFLGWSLLYDGEHLRRLQERFAAIPMVSMGKPYDDVPFAYFRGGDYISQMLLHLIEDHGRKRIAFIESWISDTRREYYYETMTEYGLFDEQLFVSSDDLGGVTLPDRPEGALAILLDERKVEFDAIIVMRLEEAKIMLELLQQRGLRVPEDVALTCYEDDLSIQYSPVPITTIYFPFKELGYASCEKLIALIREGDVPAETIVPGSLLIRQSCGCVNSGQLALPDAGPSGDGREDALLSSLDLEALDAAFERSMQASDTSEYVAELKRQMDPRRRIQSENQQLVTVLRQRYADRVQGDSGRLLSAERIWHAARIAVSEAEKSWIASEMIRSTRTEEILEEFSQSLLNTYDITKTLESLSFYLRELDIPGCDIFLRGEGAESFASCTHIFAFDDYVRLYIQDQETDTRAHHRRLLEESNACTARIVTLMHVDTNYLGYIVFEPGPWSGALYLRLAIQLSNAIAGTHMVDRLQREIALRRVKEQQLLYHAHFDAVTDMLNRRSFNDAVKLLQERRAAEAADSTDAAAEAGVEPDWYLFYADMDGFKGVNDSMGHDAGDQVLAEVSRRIRQVMEDCVVKLPKTYLSINDEAVNGIFRIGGDEFTMIVKQMSRKEAAWLAARLIEKLRMPFYAFGTAITLSCSLGISCYPADTNAKGMLIRHADMAMYYAKKRGGNSFAFFDMEMEQEAERKLELGNYLRHALDYGELSLVYQPLVKGVEGAVIGVEALLRWNHPKLGAISPGVFIPLAEELGLIVRIGEWVLREACRQAIEWQRAGYAPLLVAVNLSVKQFQDGLLAAKVQELLQETGLGAEWLELEITENVSMQAEHLPVLHQLRNLGVAVSIDDFGTHYSSLSYLKRFPVTKLKLDQSFVRGIQTEQKDREMIKAIISVAKAFELDIIAEGVETLAEAEFLIEMGCTQMQGYYFHRPMAAEQVRQLLKRV